MSIATGAERRSHMRDDRTQPTTNAVAGISGGRSSARMAYMVQAMLSFQNTGCENGRTYDFIKRLEQDLRRPIHRLEFRAPPRGEPPVKASFEVVEHRHLARSFKVSPFRDMLECLKAYRAKVKNLGPVAPWARSRICTAYLKIRTQRKWCQSLGWGHQRDYTEYVGLRADEPARIARMKERNQTLDTDERAPLADAGITRADVLAFWAKKRFDLNLAEHLGNCEDCFLKNESDLATSMLDPNRTTDPTDFIFVERDYAPMRRGRSSYAQVWAEAPARMEIRRALAEGRDYSVDLPRKRVSLIVAQETERARSGSPGFSCECDAAKADDFDADPGIDDGQVSTSTDANKWVCADCGAERPDDQRCDRCQSPRVVLISIVKAEFGDDWTAACFPGGLARSGKMSP